jgi:hypothetical protein
VLSLERDRGRRDDHLRSAYERDGPSARLPDGVLGDRAYCDDSPTAGERCLGNLEEHQGLPRLLHGARSWVPMPVSRGLLPESKSATAAVVAPLPVHQVGDFVASFVRYRARGAVVDHSQAERAKAGLSGWEGRLSRGRRPRWWIDPQPKHLQRARLPAKADRRKLLKSAPAL